MTGSPTPTRGASLTTRWLPKAVADRTAPSAQLILEKLTRQLGAPAPGAAVGIAVGSACAALSLMLRFVSTPYIGDGEALLTAFPLVLVAALSTGRWGGWTTLVVCTIGSWYLFIGDKFTFSFGRFEKGILIGTFLAGAFVIQICVVLRRAFREIADLRATERLLSRELEHRIKNTLTLVLSISRQTFRPGRPPDRALDDFEGRMIALAAAQDLTGRAEHKPAQVARVVERSLSPFCGEGMADRLELSGPDVDVNNDVTIALFLVFHELATNSAKYGALSKEHGTIAVAWRLSEEAERRLALVWLERGGPPVRAPEHEGFGTKLLHRIVTRTLKGTIALDYPQSGVRAELSLPI